MLAKVDRQSIPSTQGIITALGEGPEIGLTKIKGTSYFEHQSAFVRPNPINILINVLEIQRAQRTVLLGVNAIW